MCVFTSLGTKTLLKMNDFILDYYLVLVPTFRKGLFDENVFIRAPVNSMGVICKAMPMC